MSIGRCTTRTCHLYLRSHRSIVLSTADPVRTIDSCSVVFWTESVWFPPPHRTALRVAYDNSAPFSSIWWIVLDTLRVYAFWKRFFSNPTVGHASYISICRSCSWIAEYFSPIPVHRHYSILFPHTMKSKVHYWFSLICYCCPSYHRCQCLRSLQPNGPDLEFPIRHLRKRTHGFRHSPCWTWMEREPIWSGFALWIFLLPETAPIYGEWDKEVRLETPCSYDREKCREK